MKQLYPLCLFLLFLASCKKDDLPHTVYENASSFEMLSTLSVGKAGAAEISAFDPLTKKLFVVTNAGTSRIDVVDLSQPAQPKLTEAIDILPYGSMVNSVSVHNGLLAAAVEGAAKTDPGKVVLFRTNDYAMVKQVAVGALPDMLTWSPDGKFILTANEGEPNDAYTIDPVGSVSLISVKNNFSVTNLDFSAFASKKAALMEKGLRMFGPGASFIQDMEPEYLTVSSDSKTAWVTLQENNAIARIDLNARRVTGMFPLGFKEYSVPANGIDPSDRDGLIALKPWKVRGMYQPDAIAVLEDKGVPYLFTANEGDVREWSGFAENKRVKDLALNPASFPDAALKGDALLGRLNVTTTLGDINNNGDYEMLFSFGARSFSVWNGNNGQQLFDSGNELEQKAIAAGFYDDGRSDDKGVEPEGLTLGRVGNRNIVFVGLERADALAIYDVSQPDQPRFIKMLQTGDAPEGITFIPAKESPVGRSLVVVSSENDGTLKIYSTK
ncbi:MAG TPA: choice-of-anchor I family protein [Chitinophagaceae bacterium]|jgi:hypothetical protein|nr:choice-of-anchor I family protein [Chitinophagaceae bacterium]